MLGPEVDDGDVVEVWGEELAEGFVGGGDEVGVAVGEAPGQANSDRKSPPLPARSRRANPAGMGQGVEEEVGGRRDFSLRGPTVRRSEPRRRIGPLRSK